MKKSQIATMVATVMLCLCQMACSAAPKQKSNTFLGQKRMSLIQKGTLQEIVKTTPVAAKQEFFEKAAPIALVLQEQHNIPASAMLAMSLYESRYGTSKLAREANNYFGIKALGKKWQGPVYHIKTRDGRRRHVQPFRQYDSMEASFEDYVTFLQNNKRYRKAFLAAGSKEFVRSVLRSGYCPDRNYYGNIVTILARHNLLQLDAKR